MKLIKYFTQNQLNLLLEMLDKGEISTKTQRTFTIPYTFYMAIRPLNDRGFVVRKKITDNRENIWCLTDRGKVLAKCLKDIEAML